MVGFVKCTRGLIFHLTVRGREFREWMVFLEDSSFCFIQIIPLLSVNERSDASQEKTYNNR